MDIVLSIACAFLICFSCLPIIIKIFKSLDLLDLPNRRKIHAISKPSLGGVAIYMGVMLSLVFFLPLVHLSEIKFLLLSVFLLFMLGVRDDISNLNALDKLSIQVFATLLVVFISDLRFTSLHGFMGFTDLPLGFEEFMTIFVIVGLTNAFNLIDGIDGLAGSLTFFILTFFGIWFVFVGEKALGIFCLSFAASVFAFLMYNWSPSKIFMGDTGSLILGFAIACMTVIFIEYNHSNLKALVDNKFDAPIGFAFGLLIIPVYDTFRVFIIRFFSGKSPLAPDKNHIHHLLLKVGFSHATATLTLLSFNFFIVLLAWHFQYLGNSLLSIFVLSTVFLFGLTFDVILKRKVYLLSKRNQKVVTF